jgi:(p)ppGpp synthase/HD superfamily hydrolase
VTRVPAYVRTAPLHAITEVYGEAGLRERFAQEIADFPDAQRAVLLDALALASDLHRDDRRVREPYVNHLLRVTIRIIHYYRVRDVDVLAAALLHDAVEDHPAELGGATPEALATIAERFNPRVAELVAAVTNPEYSPDRDAHEQYREHVAASLAGNPWARVIKLSDFTDNGVGLIHTSGPKVDRSARKYAPLVPVLRDLLRQPDTPLPEQVRELIAGQLDRAEERFAAILDTHDA